MVKYIQDFKCNKDIAEQFSGSSEYRPYPEKEQVILDLLDSSEVLLAWYGGNGYDGQAMVVYRHEGKLFEVNGSHCSCYGLEDQWSPEETNYHALLIRDPKSVDSSSEFIEAYYEMLDILMKDNK